VRSSATIAQVDNTTSKQPQYIIIFYVIFPAVTLALLLTVLGLWWCVHKYDKSLEDVAAGGINKRDYQIANLNNRSGSNVTDISKIEDNVTQIDESQMITDMLNKSKMPKLPNSVSPEKQKLQKEAYIDPEMLKRNW
jgi:hypothetical protein